MRGYGSGPSLVELLGALFRWPDRTLLATNVAERAREWQERLLPRGAFPGHNDEADAFRHCLASALLTMSIGPTKARELLTAHEEGWSNPSIERKMDLHNNEVGITIGTQHHRSDKEMAFLVAKAIVDGRLMVIAPRGLSPEFAKLVEAAVADPERY